MEHRALPFGDSSWAPGKKGARGPAAQSHGRSALKTARARGERPGPSARLQQTKPAKNSKNAGALSVHELKNLRHLVKQNRANLFAVLSQKRSPSGLSKKNPKKNLRLLKKKSCPLFDLFSLTREARGFSFGPVVNKKKTHGRGWGRSHATCTRRAFVRIPQKNLGNGQRPRVAYLWPNFPEPRPLAATFASKPGV